VKAWSGKNYAFESELEDLYSQYRVGRAARPARSPAGRADAMRARATTGDELRRVQGARRESRAPGDVDPAATSG
jgi:hypothetical protein